MTYASRDAFIFRATTVDRNVHHFEKDHPHDEWRSVMWQDIFKERTEKQKWKERNKRSKGVIERKPGCVWVFYNDTDFFCGWYIYIVTLKNDWGINFRHGSNKELISKAMEIFPGDQTELFDDFSKWCNRFCKKYPFKGFKKYGGEGKARPMQGMAHVSCLIEGVILHDIQPL